MRYLLYLVLLVFLLSLLTGLTTIGPGEKGVVTRFGQVIDKVGPGLYVGLPWGIDQVTRVKLEEIRSVDVGYFPEKDDESGMTVPPGQMVTGDHNLVNIQATVHYVVNDEEVEKFVFQQDQASALVARAAEAVLAQWVAQNNVDTVILTGKMVRLPAGQKSLREFLVEETQKRLEPYQLGVLIKSAEINQLNPPSQVKEAFDEVFQAETQIKTLEYQAKEYSTRKVSEAEASAYQTMQTADAFHYQKKSQAETVAKNFEKWVTLAKKMKEKDGYYLNSIWWDQVPEMYELLRTKGQIDLLDHRLGANGLDITLVPGMNSKK